MQLIGHLIIRLMVIFFGLFVALIASSIFLSFGLFSGSFTDLFSELNLAFNPDPYADQIDTSGLVSFLLVLIGFISSFYVASIAALPVFLSITIAEIMRWQSMTINLILGGGVGLFTGLSVFTLENDGLPSDGTLVVLLSTGFIGGFAYWLIAGRSAGNWLGEDDHAQK